MKGKILGRGTISVGVMPYAALCCAAWRDGVECEVRLVCGLGNVTCFKNSRSVKPPGSRRSPPPSKMAPPKALPPPLPGAAKPLLTLMFLNKCGEGFSGVARGLEP